MEEIYLDNNASTKICPEVRKEMLSAMENGFGNPSSQHYPGKKARSILENARSYVAELLGCSPENIIFTSGGTESNNLAILGSAGKYNSKRHFITSSVEHPSVLKAFEELEKDGHRITRLAVNREGEIDLRQLEEAIDNDTVLISIMMANNETGVIFPTAEIVQIAQRYNIPVHCDAVQGIGRMPINVNNLKVDFLSLSAHKIHGPKGAGALYVRDKDMISAIISGGEQEYGKRGGTEALPALAGMGMACRVTREKLDDMINKMKEMHEYFEGEIIKNIPGAVINGIDSPRLWNTSNIRFPSTYGQMLSRLSDAGVYASHGSACSSHSGNYSYVLESMGLSRVEINNSIRFSLSRETTLNELKKAVGILKSLTGNLSQEGSHTSSDASAKEPGQNYSYISNFKKGLGALKAGSAGDPTVCIAVLDGPVDISHPCFAGANLQVLESLATSSVGTGAASSHGTHVASILFGQKNSPVSGITPSCRGILVPIFFDEGENGISRCSQLDLARAITQSVDAGANIINISGGQLTQTEDAEEYLEQAVSLCRDRGVLLVAAAGNDGCDCIHIPASMPSVLAVGALDKNGVPLPSSNWGAAYESQGILAPGEGIPGALPGGGTGNKTGTSFSTPIVTGVIGLMLSMTEKSGVAPPDPYMIKEILLKTASRCEAVHGEDCKKMLAGRLNISSALELLNQLIGSQNNITINDYKYNKMKGRIGSMENMENIESKETQLLPVSMSNQEEKVEAAGLPDIETTHPQEVQNMQHVTNNSVNPSACGGSSTVQKVYVIGKIGYDFGTEARRDFFIQRNVNPFKPLELLNYLNSHPEQAPAVIWTLNHDQTPIYAIQPSGAYASYGYSHILSFLKSQITENAEMVSIPGYMHSKVTLLNGQEVPGIIPDTRGMYCWSIQPLLEKTLDKSTNCDVSQAIKDFLTRLYYEIRNLGITSQERSLNYAATNIYQVEQVFSYAFNNNLSLDSIETEKSVICRPGSDCWDIKLTFFNPLKVHEEARKVFRFTVDVSDVVPVSVGEVRSWSIY